MGGPARRGSLAHGGRRGELRLLGDCTRALLVQLLAGQKKKLALGLFLFQVASVQHAHPSMHNYLNYLMGGCFAGVWPVLKRMRGGPAGLVCWGMIAAGGW